jgi:uncharacterized protein YdbL (DUF1318 family)
VLKWAGEVASVLNHTIRRKGMISIPRMMVGIVGTALVIMAACVTVNIYFPAAEVQRAADIIVDEVRPENVPPSSKPSSSKPQSLHKRIMIHIASLVLPSAEAAVDIEISTPAIRNLKASLKNRYGSLKPYYDKGVIGETNRGYIEIRDTGKLDLKQKGQIKRLSDDENADRRALYEEIIRANKLESKVLPEVERVFANSWRDNAKGNGWWIQKDDGAWTK